MNIIDYPQENEISSIKSPPPVDESQQWNVQGLEHYSKRAQIILNKLYFPKSSKTLQEQSTQAEKVTNCQTSVNMKGNDVVQSPDSPQQQFNFQNDMVIKSLSESLPIPNEGEIKVDQQNQQPKPHVQEAIRQHVQAMIHVSHENDLNMKSAQISSLTFCRLLQFVSICGSYIYYIFWLLYTNQLLYTQDNIKELDSTNMTDEYLFIFSFACATLSLVCQLTLNLSAIIELKKSNTIKQRKILLLKISFVLFEIAAFALFLIYNQNFQSDFIIAGFFNFSQTACFQYYYYKQYQDFASIQAVIYKQQPNILTTVNH